MKTGLTRLSTKDIATLAKRVLESSKSGKYPVVENHELLLAIENEYKAYSDTYSKSTYSGKGTEVAEADDKRDKLFNSIKSFVKGYTAIETMPNSADAVDLYAIFEKFGLTINQLSYAEESAQMIKLIEELEKPENTAKLTALGIQPTFNELKAAQQNFETVYAQQAEANANLRNLPSATGSRKNLEIALRNYFNLLTAMKNISGWEMIYADINELVKGI